MNPESLRPHAGGAEKTVWQHKTFAASGRRFEQIGAAAEPADLVDKFSMLDEALLERTDVELSRKGMSADQLKSERILATFDEGERRKLGMAIAALRDSVSGEDIRAAVADIAAIFEPSTH